MELAGEVCNILTVSIIRSKREFSPAVVLRRFTGGSSCNLHDAVEPKGFIEQSQPTD